LDEAQAAWESWTKRPHLYSKRTLLQEAPTQARAVFIDGFLTSAESRDQRISQLEEAIELYRIDHRGR
jgi:hypothetical protein